MAPDTVVIADRVQIAQILTNLLANADRHARQTILVRVARRDGLAAVDVIDDGGGVPAEDLDRIFERFVRLADSRRADSGGTGLGLPIAREIADSHGGSLSCAPPDPARPGACFTLTLPPAAEPRSKDAS